MTGARERPPGIARSMLGRAVAGALLAVGGAACAAREGEAPPRDRITLRVVLQPYLAHAPFFIANAESLWALYGLEVELIPLSRATDAVPLLLSGDVDVLPTGASPALLNSAGRGLMVRAVADRGYLDPAACSYFAMVARPGLVKDGRLTAPLRRVSIDRQPHSRYVASRMLEHAGIALDTLDTVDVPLPARLDALRKGAIDAAFAGEPWLTRITSGGYGELWIAANKALPGFETGLVFFGPNLLNGNREGGRRFMLAYRDAVLRYQEGKTARNVDILAKATGDTPDVVRRSCWVPIRADGRVDLASYTMLQEWAVRMGMIDTPATPAQFWDSSFVVHADSVMGRRPQ